MKFLTLAVSVCLLASVHSYSNVPINSDCSFECPEKDAPVCTAPVLVSKKADDMEYDSECWLGNYNCAHPHALYQVIHPGTCADFYARGGGSNPED